MLQLSIVLLLLIQFAAAQDGCSIDNSVKRDCGDPEGSETTCNSWGCCYQESETEGVPWCYIPEKCYIDNANKVDCGGDITTCASLGCCWEPDQSGELPWCYHSLLYNGTSDQCDVPRGQKEGCGHGSIKEPECLSEGCCWAAVEGDPWCYRQATSCINANCAYGNCVPYYDDYYCECFYGYEGRSCAKLQAKCDIDPSSRQVCGDGTSDNCFQLGCCWDGSQCYVSTDLPSGPNNSCSDRNDSCGPTDSREYCLYEGCCWDAGYNNRCYPPSGNCDGHNCVSGHGVCVPSEESYVCDCYYGYHGEDCGEFADICSAQPADRVKCNGGDNKEENLELVCLNLGCCFDSSAVDPQPKCFHSTDSVADQSPYCVNTENKQDCGYFGISRDECLSRGCCWDTYDEDNDQPALGAWCYEADFCSISPCQNGATCENGEGEYVCRCPEGWEGKNCSQATTTLATTESDTTESPAVTEARTKADTTAPDSTRATTQSVKEEIEPQYQIILNGNFSSRSGEDYSGACIAQYTSLMKQRVLEMGSFTNTKIGTDICANFPNNEIYIVASSSFVVFHENKEILTPTFQLKFIPDMFIRDVESCAQEVIDYLVPHSNWGLPILPAVPDCPEVEFTTNFFSPGSDKWICMDFVSVTEEESLSAGPLRYSFTHIGGSETEGGVSIDPVCMSSYSTDFYSTSGQMVGQTNDLITSGQLCPGHSLRLLTSSAFLSFQEHQGVSTQNYFLEPSAEMTFAEVYECAAELSVHLSFHSNWITPIIPQVPGCPTVNFKPKLFRESSASWICE